jgi:hypothetical protein
MLPRDVPSRGAGVTEQLSRQRRWQIKRQAEGRCVICGNRRGKTGTKHHCRLHADQNCESVKRSQARKRAKRRVA